MNVICMIKLESLMPLGERGSGGSLANLAVLQCFRIEEVTNTASTSQEFKWFCNKTFLFKSVKERLQSE